MQEPLPRPRHQRTEPSANIATLADILPAAALTHTGGTGLVDLDGSILGWPAVTATTRAVAARLAAAGVGPGDRVAVLHPKSAASFIAVHGILAAGAVMVPLDPLGASSILCSIFEQCQLSAAFLDPATAVRLIPEPLTRSSIPIMHSGDAGPLLDLGLDGSRLIQAPDQIDPPATDFVPPPLEPEDPAYLIFTSGSTGTPKGMVHSHRSGLAYARTAIVHHRLDESSRVAGIPPLHFDMSTLELYSAPLVGATAVSIGEAEQRFPATLSQRLANEAITHIYAVPFLLRQLQERGALEQRDLTALRHIGYAGEPYAPGAVAELMVALPHVGVTNLYGPAETNVVTSHDLVDVPEGGAEVPIGRLWPGCEARVVTEDGSDAEPGQPGELWVSAPTCMTGYWRRPDLTAERLHPRPDGWPWYTTGDIVARALDPSGENDEPNTFRYLGRRDHQVKIRGVRLELEPIESVLTDAPGIEHAVAGAIETKDGTVLMAAVVLQPDHDLDLRGIRRWCAGQLPAAAVPSDVVTYESLPMTASGKIDRTKVRLSMERAANSDPDTALVNTATVETAMRETAMHPNVGEGTKP